MIQICIKEIIGARELFIQDFYFMAALRATDNKIFCGAVIIAPDLLVTSAVCVQDKTINDFTVYVSRWNYEKTKFIVSEIIDHPSKGTANDEFLLTLVKIHTEHKLLRPVKLIEKERELLAEGTSTIICGYGETEHASASSELIYLYTETISQHECSLEWNDLRLNEVICTKSPTSGGGAGIGDEGGPLLTEDSKLVGIISGPGSGEKADKFVKISQFRDWLNQHIEKDEITKPAAIEFAI